MPRWRAYRSLEWFIFVGLSVVTFLALVASVTLFIIGRQVRVVAWQQPVANLISTPTAANSQLISDAIELLPFINNTKDFGWKHYQVDTASTTLKLNEEEFLGGVGYETYDADNLYYSTAWTFCKEEEKKYTPCINMNRELKALFEEAKKLIINPRRAPCSLVNITDKPHREVFKDKFHIAYSERAFFPPVNYITVSFSLKPDEVNQYTLGYFTDTGESYCYKGTTDGKLLGEIMKKFSKYNDTYLADTLEPDGSNWRVFLNQTPNKNIEQELLNQKNNWKTYTLEKTGFTMKYPDIYEVSDSADDSFPDSSSSMAMFFETGEAPSSSLIVMSNYAGKTSMTVGSTIDSSVANESIQTTFDRLLKSDTSVADSFYVESLKINGIEALKITSKNPQSLDEAITKTIFFKHGDVVYSITFVNFGSDFYLEMINTIDFLQ